MREIRSGRALSLRRGAVFAVGSSTPQFACAQLGRVIQRLRPYFLTARFKREFTRVRPSDLRLARCTSAGWPASWAFIPASHHAVTGIAWGGSGDRVEHYSWTHGSLLSFDFTSHRLAKGTPALAVRRPRA